MSKARLVINITETERGFRAECEVIKQNGFTKAGDTAMALAENLPVLVEHLKTLTNEQNEKEKQHATQH